jgi:uncharacterized membrane protein
LPRFAVEGGDQPGPGEGTPRPRIQTLSDLIFGLALSIGALSLISEKPTDLLGLADSLLGFGFAFAILALIWVRYTRIMSVLPVESGTVMRVNLLMLFLVSVEPYLFNILTSSGSLGSDAASAVYAVDLGSIFLILAYFTHEVAREEKHLIHKELVRQYRQLRNAFLVATALFYVSTLPIFWDFAIFSEQVRFIIWLGALAIWLARVGVQARRPHPSGED